MTPHTSLWRIFLQSIEKERDCFAFKGSFCFREKLIDHSTIGKEIDDYLQLFINSKIINSYYVNRFDGRAIYVIKQLFKAYYQNPRQMSDQALNQMNQQLCKLCSRYRIENANIKSLLNVHLRSGNRDQVEYLIKLLQADINPMSPGLEESYSNMIKRIFEEHNVQDSNNLYEELKKYNNREAKPRSTNAAERLYRLIIDVNYCFLSSICNYIAGMTDNYALDEFQRLYAIEISR